MLLSKHFLFAVAISVGVACGLARAADEPKDQPGDAKPAAEQAAEPKAPSADEINKLAEQLDAERFSERQQASEKLFAAGKDAIPALAKTAVGDSLEATSRAIEVLKKLLDSSDDATKEAAKSALEKIAKSDKPAAARRADEALKSLKKEPDNQAGQGGVVMGNVQIQVGGMGMSRRSMKNINGVKEIEAVEDGKTVKISDDPKNGIKIEVTKKKDGKDVTEKFEAKNVEELKKKSPEGYKLYKQYAEDQGGLGALQLQIQGGPLQILPNRVPAIPIMPIQPPVPLQPVIPPAVQPLPAGAGQLEVAGMMIRTLNAQLDALKANLKTAPEQSKGDLKKQIAELKQRLAETEKALEK